MFVDATTSTTSLSSTLHISEVSPSLKPILRNRLHQYGERSCAYNEAVARKVWNCIRNTKQ